MLAIRLQRLGRKDYPVYRLAIQEASRHPSSGRVVAYVGNYNPHTKEASVQVELAQKYLDNGAQPTPRVAKLLKEAGVKLPDWVKQFDDSKKKQTKKSDKLRKNQPKEETPEEAAVEAPAEEVVAEAETKTEAEAEPASTEEAAK